MNPTPTKCLVFTTRGSEIWQRAIGWVTWMKGWRLRDVPGHAGIIFEMSDGTAVYFESHWNSGWAGPKPASKLLDWAAKPGNKLEVYDTRLGEKAVLDVYLRADYQRGRWAYPVGQLWFMYLNRRLGLPISDSPAEPVCSEAVSRLLEPHIFVPKLAGVQDHDYVAPVDLANAMKLVSEKDTDRIAV